MEHTAHGTGADIIPLGTHGLTALGDIMAGMIHGIMEATMTRGTTADGMTLGITAAAGAGTAHGTIIITTTTIITRTTALPICLTVPEGTEREHGTATGMQQAPTELQ